MGGSFAGCHKSWCTNSAKLVLKTQAKEIERLNSVYVKLLEGAGVKLFGARTGRLLRGLQQSASGACVRFSETDTSADIMLS